MKLTVGNRDVDLTRPVVMSIVNITPDSFFGGSRNATGDDVARRVERAVADGASILDVGGYSSRPGADNVTPDEELRRLSVAMDVIRSRFGDFPVSVDTFRAEVIGRVIRDYGPCIVNDITAAGADPAIAGVAARYGVPFVAMHMRGMPDTMQRLTQYDDLMGDIGQYFEQKIALLRDAGVGQIVLDPGFGFAKTTQQNFRLLGRLSELVRFGLPVLAGLSRKTMIYKTLGTTPDDALSGTTALHWECLRQGASILRAHDTREAVQVVALYNEFTMSNTANHDTD